MFSRAVITFMGTSAAAGRPMQKITSLYACLFFLLLYMPCFQCATKKVNFHLFCAYSLFFRQIIFVLRSLFINFALPVGCIPTHTTLDIAFFQKIFLTNRRRSCILNLNSKTNRYDDREKVPSGRSRELPGGARQCRAGGCHWPLSISAETALFRRKRVSSPLPERRDSSGQAPGRCRKWAWICQ